MKWNTEDLLKQLKDYHRFIGTLIVISSYLYIGAVINIYVRPQENGGSFLFLSLAMIAAGIVLLARVKRIRMNLDEEERA